MYFERDLTILKCSDCKIYLFYVEIFQLLYYFTKVSSSREFRGIKKQVVNRQSRNVLNDEPRREFV